MKEIKIFIIDENKIFNYGIKAFLGKHNTNIKIAGEAVSFKESLETIQNTRPDIIVTDFFILLKNEGLEFMEYVKKQFPGMEFLIFSSQIDREYIIKALNLGVKGFLSKNDDIEDLSIAINHVFAGKKYFGNSILNEMINLIQHQNKPSSITGYSKILTLRENEILQHIKDGKTSKEIASFLQISVRTVNNHRYNIMTKMGVNNTAALIKATMEE